MNECILEVVKVMCTAMARTGQCKLFPANATADDPSQRIA